LDETRNDCRGQAVKNSKIEKIPLVLKVLPTS